MSLHKDIIFADQHTAKFKSGLAAARAATPDGVGDVYYATDTQVLSVTNTAGSAWVTFSGAGSVSLNDLTDVTITTPTDGQALVYQTGTWINGTTAVALTDLTDISITTPALGDRLRYNTTGSVWENVGGNFDDLEDVLITAAALGNVVVYQGGQWKNLPTAANGLFLKTNSAATYGVEWASGAGGSTTLAALTDVAITGQAKGDLLAANGATDWQNLGVGSNGQILYADSTQTLGMRWDAAPTSGGTSALENAWTTIPSKPSTITTLGTSATTLVNPASGDTYRVNSVVFYADHSTDPQTVKLYYWDGSTNNLLAEKYIPKSGSWVFKPEHPLIIPDNYELRASSTNTSSTTAVVSGGYITTPVVGLIPTHLGDGQTTGGTDTIYTVPTGANAYLAHVIAYCFGTTGVTTGSDFTVSINNGSSKLLASVCIRQHNYMVFEFGVTLDENWTIEIAGGSGDNNFWIDGAVTG